MKKKPKGLISSGIKHIGSSLIVTEANPSSQHFDLMVSTILFSSR